VSKKNKNGGDPLLNNLLKSANNQYSSIIEDGIIGDESDFIDSGSYLYNAQLSGSLYGGFPTNKVTALAGESGVGKTFFAIQAIKKFQNKFSDGIVLYFESESAITKAMMVDRGVNVKKVAIMPVETIQQFRHQVLNVLNGYEADSNPDKPRLLLVLDSLGNLSTDKEISDITEGNSTRDMTRAQLVRGAFRAITLKMGILNVPMILTNHVYDTMGLFSTKKMGGGGGTVYAASTISFLSKAQDKVGTDIVGGVLTSTLAKGRLTKEKTKVKINLNFTTGLHRYYGLLEFGEKYEIFTKIGTKWKMPNGDTAFQKAIYKNPEKYFTTDIMTRLEEAAAKEFLYGSSNGEDYDDGEIGNASES